MEQNTVVLRESGWDTSMTYSEAEANVREAGYPAPSDLGYNPEDCEWFGSDYAKSTFEKDWNEKTLYWLAR